MIKEIIFDDEIIVWWERGDFPANTQFFCDLNGECLKRTQKTHVRFCGLSTETEYFVKITTQDGETVLEKRFRTKSKKKALDVTKAPYFAKGDGKTLNTKALQKALDDCDENTRVYLPKGVYLTGALRVQSNTELFISPFAVLQGTTEVEDYLPKIPSRFEGITMPCYSSLLNMGEMDAQGGYNCEKVTIRGGGRIVGGGKALMEGVIAVEKENMKQYLQALGAKIEEYETPDTVPARARPRLINVSNTQDVIISDVGIEYGPAWNLHLLYSKNVTVCGCTIKSKGVWNGDGIDPDSCENVAIFNCEFATGDDCVAIKSGKNPEGNVINRRCANLYIFDCKGDGHGISIGSEMSGGVENVWVWDCDMPKMCHGLHIKSTRKRGGYVKNVHVNNCTFALMLIRAVPYNDDGEGAISPPEFSQFYFKNTTVMGLPFKGYGKAPQEFPRRHIVLCGFGEDAKIQNVRFENMDVRALPEEEWLYLENVQNLSWDGQSVK